MQKNEHSDKLCSGNYHKNIKSKRSNQPPLAVEVHNDIGEELISEVISRIRNGFSENRVNTVKNVNVFEDKPIPPENCALTLYFADKGEKLWDIAKSHNTKLDLLLSENSAENQVLDAPKMLLIPRI